uniref:hypothetical protein n=1 Tax=Sphingomonas sp. TaxID=28214 RepID=UPI0025FF74F7|nr:hypothetical protein [Sphingomonas sp.]
MARADLIVQSNAPTLAHTPSTVGLLEQQMRVLRTAIAYFAIIFAFAFVLGALRVTLVVPLLGAMNATIVEIAIVLTASWLMARRLIAGRDFGLRQRATIGAIAFALLMIAEFVLAMTLRGQNLHQWAATLMTPVGLIGLAGQSGFAAMPIVADLEPRY